MNNNPYLNFLNFKIRKKNVIIIIKIKNKIKKNKICKYS